MKHTLSTSLLFLFLCSCSDETEKKEVVEDTSTTSAQATRQERGCKACHIMTLDPAHDLDCTVCHNGNTSSSAKEGAHENLIMRPAHPDHMAETCGQCHQEQVENVAHSLHFTLKDEINLVRTAFGAQQELASLTEIPVAASPGTVLELADDLLRRRCLRCHPYFSGDRYPAVVRGTGCASCHLEFSKGKLVSHSFMKTPGDNQCLQCHYGNWVGYDYYGRYEHDMNDEYRTPYTTRYEYFRPFGVEFHQLAPDVHQQKGLVCVDCHGGDELMGGSGTQINCAACHDKAKLKNNLPTPNITSKGDTFSLLAVGDGKEHPVPFMKHPAHLEFADIAHCQVCHAQWAFEDKGTHLLRSDLDEYDDFSRLTVQGSFEIETILKNNLDYDAEEMDHSMTDKITGAARAGLWYKGYGTRRWENITIGRDDTGKLQVMRPLLDIYLSWIDEEEEVHFDSVPATTGNNGFVPYVPHTTGKAGLFYRERIESYLLSEKSALE